MSVLTGQKELGIDFESPALVLSKSPEVTINFFSIDVEGNQAAPVN